jgi:hypothetical protein
MKTRYSKPPEIKHLEAMADEAARRKNPNTPPSWLAPRKYRDDTANALTKAILDFLRLEGWQAERVSNTGRPINGTKTFTDVVGNRRTIGTVQWIPGTGTKGTADISATIAGRSVKIEVKIGRDRQSNHQLQYQRDIEAAGGTYYIAKDFPTFVTWYKSFVATD